jgi:hypothetical protein
MFPAPPDAGKASWRRQDQSTEEAEFRRLGFLERRWLFLRKKLVTLQRAQASINSWVRLCP